MYGGMISERRVQRMRQVLERRQDDLAVVVEDIHDPHNASAILRSADAFGVGGSVLVYRTQPQPRISRMVSGQTKRWAKLERLGDPAEACELLRGRGLKVLATVLSDKAMPYTEVDWTEPVAVVMGSERDGCSPEMLAAVDGLVTIPMLGFGQSLNVSVAAAVILGEAARQRQEAGMYGGRWSDEKQAIFDAWIDRELPSRRWRELEAPELRGQEMDAPSEGGQNSGS